MGRNKNLIPFIFISFLLVTLTLGFRVYAMLNFRVTQIDTMIN